MNKNNSSSTNASSPEADNNTSPGLSRRSFLARSGSAAAVGIALGSSLYSATSWAARAVGEQASATLMRMARDIYPHDTLEDKYYAKVMMPLARKAEQDSDLRKQLKDGVSDLNRLAVKHFGKPYMDVSSESQRVKVLTLMEDSAFFQRIKGDLMMGIYNNPELWPRFGYGGSAFEHGGYLERGYNDIDWL